MVGIKSIVEALKKYNLPQYNQVDNIYSLVSNIYSSIGFVSNSDNISAADNTSGLTVSLNKKNKKFINIYYNVGGACEIYVEVSVDNESWRLLDKIVTKSAKEGIEQYLCIVYPYIRVRTPTTGIDVTFEIVAV